MVKKDTKYKVNISDKKKISDTVFISKKFILRVFVPITAVLLIAIAVFLGYLIGTKNEDAEVLNEGPAPTPIKIVISEPSAKPEPTPSPEPSPSVLATPTETKESSSSKSYGRLQRTENAGREYYESLYYVGGLEIVNLANHTNLPDDHVLAKDDGFTHISALNDERFKVPGKSGRYTIPDALGIIKPKSVLLCFGYNGAPYMSVTTFVNYYERLVDAIKEATPKTKIIIQMCYPITYGAEQEELLKVRDVGPYTNEKIHEINSKLQSLAKDKKIYYLASDGVIKLNDEDASPLDPVYADSDGMRLTVEANKRIEDYIREHKVPN